MSFHNNHESNSAEFIDNSLQQQPYYENVSNTTSDYVTIQNNNVRQSIPTSNVQAFNLPNDEHNDFVSAPHASAKVSIPKISKRLDTSQNQILKIELEIVIKLQNDQTQQRTQYVRSSTLNRMNPYRKPTEQNFRNQSSDDAYSYSFVTVPQLNRSSAVYMQNFDNIRSQFQPNVADDDNTNETFNYDN
ncbi:hypothetical protein RclHR1_10300004 [Rhizophagus clarus]|uniref:Uncharacterized protein n=1 Tax=Rhizophagus clarus TaxID=94130 RepID=A0A2Z6Q291_9GLOM|nr:hypothetical protein RclHR1_10300004 [Rhizophagus clarus]GES74788.1 hypothetical protein GLOIN_2v1770932 [Rhizophagus clarus]